MSEIAVKIAKENDLCYEGYDNSISLMNIEEYLKGIASSLSNISKNTKTNREKEKGNNLIKEKIEKIKGIKDFLEVLGWIIKNPALKKLFCPLLMYLCSKFPFLQKLLDFFIGK